MSGYTTNRTIGRRRALAGAGLLLAAPTIVAPSAVRAQGPRGVAFVIGNSRYQWEAQLANVRRDVADVAKRFEQLGLRTQLFEDLGRDALKQATESLRAQTSGANFAAFYYAGHGAAWNRRNYLVPVDADLSNPSVTPTLIPLNATDMREAKHKLWVFDNCRNNPADGWQQTAEERGAVAASNSRGRRIPNGLILYSTAPGHVALDGPAGQNSPFAAAFLREFKDASADLQSISSRLRRDLLMATAGRQVLWDANGFDAPFSIDGNPRATAAMAGSGGWAGDPSRIVELPNAYAHAREIGLPLPSGLAAYRPAAGSKDAWKVGAFKFETHYGTAGAVPRLLVVISVEGDGTAQVIFSTKGIVDKFNKVQSGSLWRFITAKVSGNRLEFAPRVDEERYIFDWRDAGGGSFSAMKEYDGNRGGLTASVPFTRLDG